MKFYLFKNSFQQWHDTHYQQRYLVQKSNLHLAKLFYLRKGFQKFQKSLQLYKEIVNFQSKFLVSSRLYYQEKKMGKYLHRWKVFTQQTAQIKYLNRMKSAFFYKLFRQMKALKQWRTMAEMWKRKRTLIRQAKENCQAHLKKKSIYLLFHSLFDDDESERKENDSNDGKPQSFFPPSRPPTNKRVSLQQLYQKRITLKYYWQQWKELLREQFERKKRENDEIQQEYQRKYNLSHQDREKESQPTQQWQCVESFIPDNFPNSASNQSLNKYKQSDYSSLFSSSNSQRTGSPSLNPLARQPPRQLRDHSSLSFISIALNNQLPQPTNQQHQQQHQLSKALPRDYSSSYSIPRSDPFNTGNHFSYYIPPFPNQQKLSMEIPNRSNEEGKSDEKEQNDRKEANLANEIFVIEEIISNFMKNAHLITNEDGKKDLLLQLQKEVELIEQKLKNTKT
jgi:hypothetical protein